MRRIIEDLADLDDGDLVALIDGRTPPRRSSPDLLAWIEGAADWQQNRRQGLSFPLRPPEAAIEPTEHAAVIGGALLLRASLAEDGRPVAVLLDAIVRLLTGGERSK